MELVSEEEASKAPQELNGKEIMGRWVTVSASMPYLSTPLPSHSLRSQWILHHQQHAPAPPYLFTYLPTYLPTYPSLLYIQVEQCVDPSESRTIKIRGVPFTAKAEELAEYFGAFGVVDRVTISHDRNGIAYVTFKDNAGAVQVGR